MDNAWISRLAEELAKPLPGAEVQLRMSPGVKRPVSTDRPLRQSGVLLLLYPLEGGIYTVFIKRSEYNGIHSGQISLPGGMFEKGDRLLRNTALREAKEETGMPIEEVRVIGQLTRVFIPVSNVHVFPFVAVTSKRPDFTPDTNEVQYLIETNLDELLNPINHKRKIMQIADLSVEVPFYDIRGNHIWGATAMILSEFLEIIRRTMC
jgi:8-oxo-dGTP pyrophosphatase MutT (NUDIX family)